MKTLKLDSFTEAYLECALWSNEFDDKSIYIDLDDSTIEQAQKDCDEFQSRAGDMLDDIENSQAGHDFWLTRNRHGAGFWDRGLGDIGDKLTDLAHEFGELDLYISDSGKVCS